MLLGIALVATACSSGSDPLSDGATATSATTADPADPAVSDPAGSDADVPASSDPASSDPASTGGAGTGDFGPAPEVPDGPLADDVVADLDLLFADLTVGFDFDVLARLGRSGDPRVAWLIADLLGFLGGGAAGQELVAAFEALTGVTITDEVGFRAVANRLIAWDLPAPPDYVRWKRRPFEIVEPSWEPFFADAGATIDFRYLAWGGVLIDDRPISTVHSQCPQGCIPAMTEPPVTDAAGGSWYSDDGIVFGVVVNGEARAYPKHQMEVHEMVNDELGGRRIAVPYCTLCGSAQAYFSDGLDAVGGVEAAEALGIDAGRFEMRTSGLLSRSNKVMFELQTFSVFDTFTGEAVSGPLREAGVHLPEITVETARWGDWKQRHPDTSIVSLTGVLGTPYPLDPLRGRDDDGPIFPIGDLDGRLDVQAPVLGVILDDGTAIAFEVDAANEAIDAGRAVELAGVRVVRDGGLRAELLDGTAVVSHQAFWFAWSQFHETLLWSGS